MDRTCYFQYSYNHSMTTECDPSSCIEKGGWEVCDFGKKYKDWEYKPKLTKARKIREEIWQKFSFKKDWFETDQSIKAQLTKIIKKNL